MGGSQSTELPCIALGADIGEQSSTPSNKSITRSEGARELIGALKAQAVAQESTHTLVLGIAEQASERLDRIDTSLKQIALEQSAQRKEFEGSFEALASRIQRLEDANFRVASKQRAMAAALSEDAAGEAPPPLVLPQRPVTLTTVAAAPPATPRAAPPGASEAAPPGKMPGAMPSAANGRQGVRRSRDGK